MGDSSEVLQFIQAQNFNFLKILFREFEKLQAQID